MRLIAAVFSIMSLAGCLAAPVAYFLGLLDETAYKHGLLACSAAWFVAATAWASQRS